MAITMRFIAASIFLICMTSLVYAQAGGAGVATPRLSNNISGTITLGNTFQELLPAGGGRQSLTIQNNSIAAENCWVYVGPIAGATTVNSILLLPGGSYQRYWPYVPSDQISITCQSDGDSYYADYQ